MTEAEPLIRGEALAGSTLAGGLSIGASPGIGEMLPGLTTLIILATFVMTLYQLYKYVQQLMNSKVIDHEGF